MPIMAEEMRAVRVTRRRAILGILVLGILVEAVLAIAVLANDETKPALTTALPMHPVAGSFKPDGTKLASCTSQRCTEQAFGNIAFFRGPSRALAVFDDEYGDFSDPDCHRVAHAIGSASLVRNNGNVARTFAQGSSSCFSGYYHGVLERALVGVRGYEPEALGAVARKLCTDVKVQAEVWLAYQCLHGLGHGLMITTGYTLPLALKVCDRLQTPWERTSCNGGAFMENISTMYGFKSRWVRDDDPVYPCNVVAQEDKLKCYEIVTSRVLRLNGADWPNAAEVCAGVEKGWIPACFRSLGRDSAGQAHQDPAKIREFCAVARPYGGEGSCVAGAAMAMTGNFKSGKQASVLCDTTFLGLRAGCYYGIGWVMSMYGPTAVGRERHCRALSTTTRLVARCVQAGNDFVRLLRSKA